MYRHVSVCVGDRECPMPVAVVARGVLGGRTSIAVIASECRGHNTGDSVVWDHRCIAAPLVCCRAPAVMTFAISLFVAHDWFCHFFVGSGSSDFWFKVSTLLVGGVGGRCRSFVRIFVSIPSERIYLSVNFQCVNLFIVNFHNIKLSFCPLSVW